MTIPNFHTHSKYCDGKGELEDYVLTAIGKGQKALGFSGHAPVGFESWWNMTAEDFEKYKSEIRTLKLKYQSDIELYLGIEADYLKNIISPADFQDDNLDYIIGSIHYLYPDKADKPWDFIISPKVFEEGLKLYYHNDIELLIKEYFRANCEMIEAGTLDITGHCDQIRKFNKGNRYFSEDNKVYQTHLAEMLQLIAEKNIILEINTRGKLKNLTDDFFPSLSTLKQAKLLNINIILSADAHKPDETDSFLTEAAHIALEAGYTELTVIKNKQFQLQNIRDFQNG